MFSQAASSPFVSLIHFIKPESHITTLIFKTFYFQRPCFGTWQWRQQLWLNQAKGFLQIIIRIKWKRKRNILHHPHISDDARKVQKFYKKENIPSTLYVNSCKYQLCPNIFVRCNNVCRWERRVLAAVRWRWPHSREARWGWLCSRWGRRWQNTTGNKTRCKKKHFAYLWLGYCDLQTNCLLLSKVKSAKRPLW